jgi:hypothetical protein
MIALWEFRYKDFQTGRSVDVPAGAELDTATLAANKVDVEKLVRTKYTGQESLKVAPVHRGRGRPRKSA